jgi:hypothetical protein
MTNYGFVGGHFDLSWVVTHNRTSLQVVAEKHIATRSWPIMTNYDQKLKSIRANLRGGRIPLFDQLAYLPLLHMLVEERVGERRFPSPRRRGARGGNSEGVRKFARK